MTSQTRPTSAALLFGFEARVDRRSYAAVGFGLMGLKYAIDVVVMWLIAGQFWNPLRYFSPVLVMREGGFEVAPELRTVATIAMAIWALPFLWVGVSMSTRRAIDAGLRAPVGLLFFVPLVNLIVIAMLCTLPSRPPRLDARAVEGVRSTRVVLAALGLTAALSVGMTVLSTFVAAQYGAALFVGTPFALGFFVGWILNRDQSVAWRTTIGVTTLGLLTSGAALMLFALEGLLCLAMAFPLAWVLGTMGAVLGKLVGDAGHRGARGLGAVLVALPALLAFETGAPSRPEREVITAIDVPAPPQAVWDSVVGWSELPADNLPWFFAAGIAYPVRARLEGRGVGAVRYCEFSTGPFVEPITAWDEPNRLAFDVRSQPPAMHEWSFWDRVDAPHLEGFMVSHRGEFRLIDLGNGRTRLEGSTWYHLDIWPQAYWAPLADALLHSIHHRVLEHVRNLSVERARTATASVGVVH